jgi:hypothetical protein
MWSRRSQAAVCRVLLALVTAIAAGPPYTQGTAPAPVTTATVDPALFSGLRWRSIGPSRGGRSIAAAGTISRPFEYYFGATGGGLWKTTDGGVTWRSVSDRFFGTSSVGAVAIAESNPDVVFVGMGEVALRGNVIQGDGIYKTVDGGKTWTHMGLDQTMAIGRIRVHPSNPDIAYVAALGKSVRPESRAGHRQDHRRRQDLGQGAVPGRQNWRGRLDDGPEES